MPSVDKVRVGERDIASGAGRFPHWRIAIDCSGYDFQGAGQTDACPGPYVWALYISDAIGLMDVLGLGKVSCVGLSTGGMIGQGLAIHHPDRIASLSRCNTFFQIEEEHQQGIAARQEMARTKGVNTVWESASRFWLN